MKYAFENLITFSRNSAATFVGSNGLIQSAPANTPRFDYDPVTLQPRGFLVEEQRTNLLTFSEQFENPAWNKNAGATISENNLTSPDGQNSADTINAAASASSGVFRSVSSTAATPYTFSIFVKNISNASNLRIGVDANPANGFITYDAVTGTITASGANVTSSTVQEFPNNWRRVSVSFVATASSFAVIVYSMSGSVANFGVWGAQLTTGAFMTSYIPTTTAQATRLADNARIDGANFAAFYKQSEGTLMAEFIPSTATNTQFAAAISDNTFNNRFSIARAADGTSRFRLYRNNVVQDATAGAALANNTLAKIALAFNQTGGTRVANGTAASFTTAPPVGPVADRMYIGADESGNGSGATNGHIRRIMYIPKRLSNTELQALTI